MAKHSPWYKHWKGDLLAGVSVALVALPLGMGMALAAGYPPVAGILAAIVGGVFGFIFGGTHVGIKGPAAGTIVGLIAALQYFGGGEQGMGYLLACTVAAGALLFITGTARLGKYAELVPSSVIKGMLAAIGFIILVKQIDEALGYTSHAATPVESLMEIPSGLADINAVSLLITAVSIFILAFHNRVQLKLLRRIPSAIWVLLLSLPWVFVFNMQEHHELKIWIWDFYVGPELLVDLPKNLASALHFPNPGMIGKPMFWMHAFSIFIILLVENLLSAKAVDKLDPMMRKTNLNRDLASSGFVTALSSFIGGMPSITVIVRSSVNLNVGGRFRTSNIFHGLILLALLFFAVDFIRLIPKAALAAILVFTGYRLCSPRKFLETLKAGWEQLAIFIITFYATVNYSLLTGIVVGMVSNFSLQYFLSGLPLKFFWKNAIHPRFTINTLKDPEVEINAKGILNFTGNLRMMNMLNKVPLKRVVVMDLSHCRLVDHTVMEILQGFQDQYERNGGSFSLVGLDAHHKSSPHPHAMHILETVWHENIGLSGRQENIKNLCAIKDWTFNPSNDYHIGYFHSYLFFRTRPPEYKKNMVTGVFKDGVLWEMCDLYFHEGELTALENLHTTVLQFKLKNSVPVFSVEEEKLYDRIRELAMHRDVHPESEILDKKIFIQGPEEEKIVDFLKGKLGEFLESNPIYHIECNGNEILVFKQTRFASPPEILELQRFAEQLEEAVNGK